MMNYRAFVQSAAVYAHLDEEKRKQAQQHAYTMSAVALARTAFPAMRVECVFSYVRITLPGGAREADAMKVIRRIYGDRFFLHRHASPTERRYDISYMARDWRVLFRETPRRFSYPGFLLFRDGDCCIQFPDYAVIKALQ